jgi:hypothetical protein
MKYFPAYAWNGLFVGQPAGLSWQGHLISWLISFDVGADPRVCPKKGQRQGSAPTGLGWIGLVDGWVIRIMNAKCENVDKK